MLISDRVAGLPSRDGEGDARNVPFASKALVRGISA